MATIEDKLNTAIEEASKQAAGIEALIKINPSDVIKELSEISAEIKTKLSSLSVTAKTEIEELLDVVANGIYYDPNTALPTARNKPNKSYFFVPEQEGVFEGIWYDVGDVVFYSAKKQRIYVIAPKDYVTSIKTASGATLNGDVEIKTDTLGIVEIPKDTTTAYIRRNKKWVALNEVIKTATTSTYGISKIATDAEVNGGTVTTTFITLKLLLEELNKYLSKNNLIDGVTYVANSDGFRQAPGIWKTVEATNLVDGVVKYAKDSGLATSTADNLAVTPQGFKSALAGKVNGVKSVFPNNNGIPGVLGIYARKGGAWVGITGTGYNPDTLNLTKATTSAKGVVRLASLQEIKDGTLTDKAIPTDTFQKYLTETPLSKANNLTANGDYVYTSDGWKKIDIIKADTTRPGLMKYISLADLKGAKDKKLLAVTPKTLTDYLADKVDIYQKINGGTADAIYGFKGTGVAPITVKAVVDRHATLTDIGSVRLADYGEVSKLIEKVLTNTDLTADEQGRLAEMGDDVINFEFLTKFFSEFKIADATFKPIDGKGYGIYNGEFLEITGSKNITELERPDGSKLSNIKATTTYFKKDIPPPDTVGVEGDICHVLDSHATPVKQGNKRGKLTTLNPTAAWTEVKQTYYLDKANKQWILIKESYVKVRNSWERVTRTKYKTA